MNKIFGLIALFGGIICTNHPILAITPEIIQDAQQIINRSITYAKNHDAFSNLFFTEHEEEYARLVKEGQSPRTLFIGCSDSRVTPEFIASAKPGDFFVVRNAGNFVPFYDTNIAWDGVAASIEYAVQVVGVKDVIVCGHSHCGAIAAMFGDQAKLSNDLPIAKKWLQFGEQAKKNALTSLGTDASKEELCSSAERLSVIFQLEHLLTYPFIKKAVEEKRLYLHGWHFNIEKGELTYFNPQTYAFAPLKGLLNTAPVSK
ncbi:MAG: carbonic anhydrase [Chlamydiales bacterium]|nr:carbonic anhydrase [Chlamydiales bacterium]